MKDINVVISGSFRKHFKEMLHIRDLLQSQGINVLSPVGNHAINPGQEFLVLDSDQVSDHRLLQDSVFAKIRCSSMLVLANIDGYIGSAAAIEVGYAIAIGVQIYALEKITDPNIAPYCRNLHEIIQLSHEKNARIA